MNKRALSPGETPTVPPRRSTATFDNYYQLNEVDMNVTRGMFKKLLQS